jgi:DNA-binding CsgD family transcriptional regulator
VASTAGFPAFLCGDPELDAALSAALATRDPRYPGVFPRAVVCPNEEVRTAVLACTAPSGPDEIVAGTLSGAGALLIDEPEHAVRLLTPAVQIVVERASPAVFLSAPGAAVWALIDSGRWKEAEQWLVPLLTSPVSAEATLIRAGTYAQLAVIAYGRGRPEPVAELLERARSLDLAGVPVFRIRLRWAQGTEAAARGAHDEAYRLLREACGIGSEVRHDWQLLPLPVVVAAAVRSGAAGEAATIVRTFEDRCANRWLSERRRSRLAAARALLLDDVARAADELTAARPAHRWPYERAVLGVELADRLRRAHRPAPAREVLVDALDTFDGLRATGWAARVGAELRTPETRSDPFAGPSADPFAGLSAQQEQIVRLAGSGLSNREIGERLFLSPRTIGSHLYRVFPQLGVANRTQLSDLLATADRQPGPDTVER